jgi:hypothetical protein
MSHDPNSPQVDRLVDEISDRSVRELFELFLETVLSLDEHVTLEATRVELRVLCRGEFLCRLAPYRELFHVQVGEDPAWETRVRTNEGCIEAVDRVIQRFVEAVAARAAETR